MSKDFTICVGTIGAAIHRSPDGGENWHRIRHPGGVFGGPFGTPLESPVRCLAVYPDNPHRILAGSDMGIYRSEDNGATWSRLDTPVSPITGKEPWTISIDPVDTKVIYVGTRPGAVFRSPDDGMRWKKLPLDLAEWCEAVGPPRVTAITVDPQDHKIVWVALEQDGLHRSLDGGDTWTRVANDVIDDIHGMMISQGDPKMVIFSSPDEIFGSTDTGESWQSVTKNHEFSRINARASSGQARDSSGLLPYSRALAIKPDDPNVIFLGQGDQSIGLTGRIERSKDRGKTWETLPLPVEPNSTIWAFGTNPADPNRVVAGTILGEVYFTSDGGDSWEKAWREFGELRAVAWMPN